MAPDQLGYRGGGQIVGPHAGQATAVLAEGGTDRVDEVGVHAAEDTATSWPKS